MRSGFKLVVGLVCSALAANASIIWGSPSLSDDNGGSYIAGNTSSAAGNTFTINLPNFSASNFGSFFANEVNIGLSVSSTGPLITSVAYMFTGAFTGSGSASYVQTANAAPPQSATFFSSPLNNSISFTPAATVNLTTQLDLADNGGLASITQVKFTVTTVPEPSTFILPILAFVLLVARRRPATL